MRMAVSYDVAYCTLYLPRLSPFLRVDVAILKS
jgi:hypothetical protein